MAAQAALCMPFSPCLPSRHLVVALNSAADNGLPVNRGTQDLNQAEDNGEQALQFVGYSCTLARHRPAQEDVMAKGQMRSNKEKKKPKADWNKKKKGGGPPPSPFAVGQNQAKTELFGKKG